MTGVYLIRLRVLVYQLQGVEHALRLQHVVLGLEHRLPMSSAVKGIEVKVVIQVLNWICNGVEKIAYTSRTGSREIG